MGRRAPGLARFRQEIFDQLSGATDGAAGSRSCLEGGAQRFITIIFIFIIMNSNWIQMCFTIVLGGWWNAVVRDLDSSLALLQYEVSNKIEWIYRGSTRLLLLYQQLQAVDRRALASGRQRTLRTTNHTLRKVIKLLNFSCN